MNLRNTSVDDFSPLTNVRCLSIANTAKTLNKLRNLEELRIYDTRVSFTMLINILMSNKRLRFIKLKYVSGITESDVAELLNIFLNINIVYKPLRAYDWHLPIDPTPIWGPRIWSLIEESFVIRPIAWNLILPPNIPLMAQVTGSFHRTTHDDSLLIDASSVTLGTIPIMIKINHDSVPENETISKSKKYYPRVIRPPKPQFERQISHVRRSKTKFVRF